MNPTPDNSLTNIVRFLLLPAASAPAGLGDCRRTITTVRTEANEDKIVSATWQSIDGLRSRQETLGVASPSTATRTKPLNGVSIATQTNPDGTSVETATSILANGNTQTTSTFKDTSSVILQTSSLVADALGRTLQSTNGRGHVTQYTYHLYEPEDGPSTIGQMASVIQINGNPEGGNLVTTTSYSLTPGSGRGVIITLPDGTHQYQTSNLRGQITHQWGSQTNPVQFTYDIVGNRATLTTYQAAVTNVETFPSGNGNLTTWTYDASGVLLSKRDAADQQVNYTYDIVGRVLTRTWARGVVTSYGYTAGQLASVQYTNDPTNTPAVSIAYDRLGRITDQSNDRSATDYDYDPASLRLIREETTIDPDGAAGPLPSLTRTLDRTRDNLQRPTGFVLGNEHAVGYGYDVSGRLATLSAQGLPNLPGKVHAFEYTYEPGSSLIDKVTGPVHEVDNTYEANRNVLSQKKNTRTIGTPAELSVIGYTVNEIGQRVQRNLSGEIRSDFYRDEQGDPTDPEALYATGWSYDGLGQVTSEDKPSTASDRGYSYDLIGNRITSTADSVTTSYLANNLNQYSSIENQQSSIINPVHDADGNMITGLLNGSGNGQFEYDGANQLILTQATATSDPTRYAYDAFGRRIAKVTFNTNNEPTAVTVFLYDGWNLIAEYKLDSGTWTLDRTYTWGIDLSGSTQGAGGVGGLLTVTKHEAPPTPSGQASTSVFYPIYDGNANIEAYLDSNGQTSAMYQYDAFGHVLSGGGKGTAIEQANFSHRFSTKYQDAETGLLYYGYRYYDPMTGRWINRDPIEEEGGLNIYSFGFNKTLSGIDPNGKNWLEEAVWQIIAAPLQGVIDDLAARTESFFQGAGDEIKSALNTEFGTRWKAEASNKFQTTWRLSSRDYKLGPYFKANVGGMLDVSSDGCCLSVKGRAGGAITGKTPPFLFGSVGLIGSGTATLDNGWRVCRGQNTGEWQLLVLSINFRGGFNLEVPWVNHIPGVAVSAEIGGFAGLNVDLLKGWSSRTYTAGWYARANANFDTFFGKWGRVWQFSTGDLPGI